jgi:hypothetical protein
VIRSTSPYLYSYSAECVEGGFCEVRIVGISEGSSSSHSCAAVAVPEVEDFIFV